MPLFKNHRKTPCLLLPAQWRNPVVCKPAPVEYSTLEAGGLSGLGHVGPNFHVEEMLPCGGGVGKRKLRGKMPHLLRAQPCWEALGSREPSEDPALEHPSPFWTPEERSGN